MACLNQCCGREKVSTRKIPRTTTTDVDMRQLKREIKDLKKELKDLRGEVKKRDGALKRTLKAHVEDNHRMLVKLDELRLENSMLKRRTESLENQNNHMKDRLRLQKQTNAILTRKDKDNDDYLSKSLIQTDSEFPTTKGDEEEELKAHNEKEEEERGKVEESAPQFQRRTTERVNEMIDAYPDDLKQVLMGTATMSDMSDIES
jgi:hypothetical protein